MDLRSTARLLFAEALDRTQIGSTLARKLWCTGPVLHVGNATFDLRHFAAVRLLAMGKAALPMAQSLLRLLEPDLPDFHKLRGLVIGTTLPAEPDPRLFFRVGAHPHLEQSSLTAARLAFDLLGNATPRTLVIFLISGGASAMVDLPLSSGISLEGLTRFHDVLVHSGLPIASINTLRKHVSAVKGGRLALAAHPATQLTLLLSDVPPSRPDLIASGPTLPDPTTLDDCRALLTTPPLSNAYVPASIRGLLSDPRTPETPKPGHPAFHNTFVKTLLSSDDLVHAAERAARDHGLHAVVDLTPDDWSFDQAAAYLLGRLDELAFQHPDQTVCLLSAGELTVALPPGTQPGLGGRNQHFALHCATLLNRDAKPTAVLSAGSDGIDGTSPAAGAVIDQTTLMRAAALALAPEQALAAYDTYPLLKALGDVIVTGPTGNNLRDLRILLRRPRD